MLIKAQNMLRRSHEDLMGKVILITSDGYENTSDPRVSK